MRGETRPHPAVTSRSCRAVNLLPFHGRQPGPVKRREERPRGAEVSLKDEPSLTHTHTCSFQHTLSLLLLSLCHSHTHTSSSHLTPNFSHQFFSFCSFTLTHSPAAMRGDPLVSASPEAPTYPREPCCGTLRATISEPEVPSFISSHSEAGSSLGKRERTGSRK